MSNTQVIIVGGGPVGLWVAAELRLAGVAVVVLERALDVNPHGRGITVHPRTLEMFEMRGVLADVVGQGVPLPGASFAQVPTLISYANLATDHPFVLAQPQARTHAIIEAHAQELGADIRRGAEVTEVRLRADGVEVSVNEGDNTYTIEADWIVGCDGVQSLVRETAGIGFPGTDNSASIWVGDVLLDEPIAAPIIEYWEQNGTLLSPQLPGGIRRFIGLTPDDVTSERLGEFTFEEMREKVRSMMGTDFGMHTPLWLSRTGNSTRLADTYRAGRALLAGDAAHRHFPLGGMGMNTGLQDAMNLGWRLAGVINGWADETTLDEYAAERRQVGMELLQLTQAQTAMTIAFTPDGEQLRNLWSDLLAESPQLVDGLAERYSGLRIAYPASSADGHVLEGQRVPNLRFVDSSERLYEHLPTGQFAFFDLRGGSAPSHQVEHDQLRSVARELDPSTTPLAWQSVTGILVRPDGYLAWATEETSPDAFDSAVQAALSSWVGEAQTTAH